VVGVGYIYVDLVVRGRASKNVRALVDTGSAYIVLDPKTISEIGLLETPFNVELTLADKRRVRAKLYLAEVEAEGRRGPAFVAELDVPTPILGTYSLETLGLKPNPATGKLEVIGPEGGYLLRIEEVLATFEELMDEEGCVGYGEPKKNTGEANT
jgi:predicted aspartyl protease